jgi:hypothetical protein
MVHQRNNSSSPPMSLPQHVSVIRPSSGSLSYIIQYYPFIKLLFLLHSFVHSLRLLFSVFFPCSCHFQHLSLLLEYFVLRVLYFLSVSPLTHPCILLSGFLFKNFNLNVLYYIFSCIFSSSILCSLSQSSPFRTYSHHLLYI